jgi:hypothetical protein
LIAILKIAVVLICALIAFQDFRERAVSWILFPLVGFFLGFLYLNATSFEQYYPFVLANVVLVSGILLILFVYTTYIAKKKFLNVSFGLGDLLFFYAFALGFPTITFLVLFVGSILFSLLAFLFTTTKGKEKETIPLAGLMGFFLIGVVLASFFPNTPSLYIL